MSQNLLGHHTIPVSDEERGGLNVTFYKWIPESDDAALIRRVGNLTSRLWLDRSCVSSLTKINDEDLSRWVNIQVSKVFVDVAVTSVPDDLAQFIYAPPDTFVRHGAVSS